MSTMTPWLGDRNRPHVPPGTSPGARDDQSPACHPLRTSKAVNSPVAGQPRHLDALDSGARRSPRGGRRAVAPTGPGGPRRRSEPGPPARSPPSPSGPAPARWFERGSGSRRPGPGRARRHRVARRSHAVQPSASPSMTSSGLTLPSSRSPASSRLRSCPPRTPCRAARRRPPGRRGDRAAGRRPAGPARPVPGRERRRARSSRA